MIASDSKNPVKFRQIYIILHITYVEMASEPVVHVWKSSLTIREKEKGEERKNLGMDNASFTFGVNFRAIWSIASHVNTLPFARFTWMCLYIVAREIYIFSISISCIWKELVHQAMPLTNGRNYFRVLLFVPLLPRQFRRQALRIAF